MPQQIRPPYGDIFLVNTPRIDQLSNQLYQEQRQRELYKQQQDKMLDDEFARNLTGIRDSDIPDLTKAYGEFKQARMQTLNKQNLSPDIQLDVLRKKAAIYDVINKSKQRKEWETGTAKQVMTDKKGLFADDAHQQLIKSMNTPVTQINPENDSKLLYPYSMPDLAKELKTARGDEKEVPITLGQNKSDALKDDKEIYKAGNNPSQFYNSLLQGVVASNKGRNFTGIVKNKYSDSELEDLQNKYYAKINDPKFVSIYGEPKPFPESSNTDLGNAVKIATMEEVVNKELKPTKLVSEINQERKTRQQQQSAKQKMLLNDALIRGRMRTAEGYKEAFSDYKEAKSTEAQNGVLNKYIDNSYDAGSDRLNGTDVKHITIDGKKYEGKIVDVPNSIKYDNSRYDGKGADGKDIYKLPDAFYLTDDKKTIIPLFLGGKTTTGGDFIDKGSNPIPIQNFKLSLSKSLLTKKATGGEVVDDEFDIGQPKPQTQSVSSKKYSVKGKSYTKSDLNKMGYTDEQIDKALKIGTIK